MPDEKSELCPGKKEDERRVNHGSGALISREVELVQRCPERQAGPSRTILLPRSNEECQQTLMP